MYIRDSLLKFTFISKCPDRPDQLDAQADLRLRRSDVACYDVNFNSRSLNQQELQGSMLGSTDKNSNHTIQCQSDQDTFAHQIYHVYLRTLNVY